MSNSMMGYPNALPPAMPGGYGYPLMIPVPVGSWPGRMPGMPIAPPQSQSQNPAQNRKRSVETPKSPQASQKLPPPQISMIRSKPFTAFVRQVNPDPPPSKLEFYWENIKNHGYPSYMRGFHRYLDMLKQSPATLIGVLVGSAALGGMLTAFQKHSQLIQSAFILGLLGYPIQAAVRQLPKMEDAYELVQQGNPKQGEEVFNKAMDEVNYRIGQVYLKPLSIAIAIAWLLKMPEGIRRIYRGEGMLKFTKPVLEALKITDTVKVMRPFDWVYKGLSGFGNKVEKIVTFRRS